MSVDYFFSRYLHAWIAKDFSLKFIIFAVMFVCCVFLFGCLLLLPFHFYFLANKLQSYVYGSALALAPYENNHSSPPHLIRLFIFFNTFVVVVAVVSIAFFAFAFVIGTLDAEFCISLLFDVLNSLIKCVYNRATSADLFQWNTLSQVYSMHRNLHLPFFSFCAVSFKVRVFNCE